MDVPIWFSLLFSMTGIGIIICFAFQHGVFENKCCCRKHGNGTYQSTRDRDRIGIGIGIRDGGSPRSEGVDSSQVSATGTESEEEGAYGNSEEESRRSGGLSEDERSEETEDWGSTV